MLTSFKIERHYNKLHLTLYVECSPSRTNDPTWDAGLCVTYDRLIKAETPVRLSDVATPEKAEAWFSRPCGEQGNFVEFMEWQCRTGLLDRGEG